MANLVAIVGRPNVGKSTLFNRLTQSRRAIVSDTAGTTRDRQYGKCQWNGREFSVVDTGGWVVKSDDIFEDAIRRQVLVATEEADLVLFVVDNETGVTDWDEDVAQILRRTKLPVILVANKVDNSGEYYLSADFYRLGLGDPVCISAQTGSGTGDLLDLILKRMPDAPDEGIDDEIPRFAVVGRPNAGKSSLINAFIGEGVALNESKGGFTLLYKGNSIEKDEYSIMQNAESANILSRLIKALKIAQIDVCGLAGDICVLNTAKDLKEVIGDVRLNVLEAYSPSLDGGAALSVFVETLK